ncbi:MAG: helix-turn-helix domain-containing protein [Rhodobacterales bacterium]|nr:helix-turn-helix domain-containing protein [Rhodobacterales bacterium]
MARQMTVAEYLSQAISLSGKSQREISQEVGWNNPNVLSMMKQGITKVPVEKAPALAKALGVDQSVFLRLVMNEYMPEAWGVIRKFSGELLTEEELELIKKHRSQNAENLIRV